MLLYSPVQAPQKSGMGGYTEEVLEWFDCPRASAHPGCEHSCRVYRIDLHRGFARASSRPARRRRKLYRAGKRTDSELHCQASTTFVPCNTRIPCCKRRSRQTRVRKGVCETLIPDIVALKHIRTIAAMHVSSADPTFDSLNFKLRRS